MKEEVSTVDAEALEVAKACEDATKDLTSIVGVESVVEQVVAKFRPLNTPNVTT